MITFGLAQILGSLKWRELSPQVTEGVPARRRQQELQWLQFNQWLEGAETFVWIKTMYNG